MTREEFFRRLEISRQRKQQTVEQMKEDLTIESLKRTGKKPTSFFVL